MPEPPARNKAQAFASTPAILPRKANGPAIMLGHSVDDQARRAPDNAGPLNFHSPTRRSTGGPDALTSAQHVLGLPIYLYQFCCVFPLLLPGKGFRCHHANSCIARDRATSFRVARDCSPVARHIAHPVSGILLMAALR